jgi:hypothetical protein
MGDDVELVRCVSREYLGTWFCRRLRHASLQGEAGTLEGLDGCCFTRKVNGQRAKLTTGHGVVPIVGGKAGSNVTTPL